MRDVANDLSYKGRHCQARCRRVPGVEAISSAQGLHCHARWSLPALCVRLSLSVLGEPFPVDLYHVLVDSSVHHASRL